MAVKNVDKASGILQVIDDEGQVLDKRLEPQLSEEDLKKLYYYMVLTRTVDDRFIRLQRQGRVGFYLASLGEEAAHIGSAFVLQEEDWIFPQYREPGAALLRGFPLVKFASQIFGNAEDLTKGRQMPCHYAYRKGKILSISSPIATQIPHAVGFAWAGKIRKEKFVVLVYFGDGATSHGDFHVGMNFAGVFKAPVVFFNKNNQWAISVPLKKQTASESIAVKAQAYGFEGIRVDGNDILAVIHATKQAVEKARQGGGPTLIEALTYRMGAHSTSDDPRLYSDPGEKEVWGKKDCLVRFQKYLEKKGIWNLQYETELSERVVEEVAKAVEEAEKIPPPPVESLFEDVYAEILPHQKEQLQELLSIERKLHPH
jgi:pyruvate dehydrogenase E1 component alpha subunit